MASQMIEDVMAVVRQPLQVTPRGGSTFAAQQAAKMQQQRTGSSKIVKVRQEEGATSILSTVGNKMFRRKRLKRAANISPQMARSLVARQRGYFAGASGVRGEGRDTGTVNPLIPSARADAVKIAPRSRWIPVGMYVPKVGG